MCLKAKWEPLFPWKREASNNFYDKEGAASFAQCGVASSENGRVVYNEKY